MQAKKKVVLIVQARMGSTRLPGKSLKLILGRPMLDYQLERLRRVKTADAIVLATTTNPRDLPLVAFSERMNLPYYRGSEEDVLDRFLQAARAHSAEVIVRITGDCPLSDPHIIDRAISLFLEGDYDYVTNSPDCNFPRGTDVEVFSLDTFEKVAKVAMSPAEREHVTPYYYRHPELFKIGRLMHEENLSFYRWTVDTPEDFEVISRVFAELYPKNPQFSFEDVVEAFKRHTEWVSINAMVKQKALGA